ncbi:M15 family metallopeptidase [Streptomyces sp. KM273126]|uniref:M15 family metallopeptidase n=1 Tax=Streptomyces sp. KM273126 TaxID=2545247 RepID=UPI0010391E67|nr:M15 family metallopeptidase [Streptomyces sp. KM273126]
MRRLLVVGLIVVLAAIAVALGYQLPNSSSPSAASPSRSVAPLSRPVAPPSPSGARLTHTYRSERRGVLGEAGGVVPDGVTVFDDDIPAVANIDPALLKALRLAARAAADDGVEFYVNSGWRSPAYQDQLLREAVSTYGSEDEAARWVATAATSPHVSGDAVDIGRSTATAWLSEHGAAYGLCQIYKNEPWHYELRGNASDRGCPRMYADPTQDPRMQQ